MSCSHYPVFTLDCLHELKFPVAAEPYLPDQYITSMSLSLDKPEIPELAITSYAQSILSYLRHLAFKDQILIINSHYLCMIYQVCTSQCFIVR